jgi:hypothetical protein
MSCTIGMSLTDCKHLRDGWQQQKHTASKGWGEGSAATAAAAVSNGARAALLGLQHSLHDKHGTFNEADLM